jgi:hypothetical protein
MEVIEAEEDTAGFGRPSGAQEELGDRLEQAKATSFRRQRLRGGQVREPRAEIWNQGRDRRRVSGDPQQFLVRRRAHVLADGLDEGKIRRHALSIVSRA